jgi:hypothetical protein
MRGTGDTGRERPQRGVVTAVESDDAWCVRLTVQLADGRTVHAQPWFPGAGPRGDYYEVDTGDVAVCLPMEGSPSDWIALVGGSNTKTPPPGAATNGVRAIFGTRVVLRPGAESAVEGIVLRPLLDDLHEVLTALQALVTALTNPLTPPGTAVQNAAILTAMRTAADLPTVGLAARLTATIADLATSKAGAGTAPHCSPVVRAQSVT